MEKPKSDTTSLESTWLGRTNFSRSIFHRVDNCAMLQLSFPLASGLLDDLVSSSLSTPRSNVSTPRSYVSDSKEEEEDSQKACGVSFPSSRLNGEVKYTSNSAGNSPDGSRGRQSGYVRSLSLPGKGGGNDDDENEYDSEDYEDGDSSDRKEDEQADVGRAASWSEYFVKSGGEYAVEEAEEWMVDLSKLFLGHRFASGAYSRLYHGIYNDKAVAVKIMRQPDHNEEIACRLERQFRCEVNVLSCLDHRNVVKFVGACRKPPVCCIITEYLSLGSLRIFLHNREPVSLPLTLVISMALDVARGMEYLHSKGVIHRDLKSENLVIAEDLCVKITDFGVACFEADNFSTNQDVGTYRWMAPEMISNKTYSKKVDVYSFGIVMWELLTGQIPFEELTAVQAAFAVVHKHARPVLPLNCPSALGQLMQKCWSSDPDKRPDFSRVIELLEEMKASSQLEMSFSAWQSPHKHANMFLSCFTGCVSKSALTPPYS